MDVVVVGLNHRTAPIEMRERLDFSRYESVQYLRKLSSQSFVRSGMVLSTCNRVEVYVTGDGAENLTRNVREFLREFHQLDDAGVYPHLYIKTNTEAVQHLFRVAASLDSMVVGEPQILGQVKEAYLEAQALSFTDPFFDRLLQKTFSVAKRVRTETEIAQKAVSVSYAAVELAVKIFGDLKEKAVLILGAGEMAELVGKHLSKHGIRELVFANRSYEHSVELAKEYGGIPVPFGQFHKFLHTSDIVVVSTAAPHYLVQKSEVEPILEERKQKPMFLIDISVPRNVEPTLDELENVFLYNIDDLQQIVAANRDLRREESEKAERIVLSELEQFGKSVEKLEVAPVIAELKQKCEVAMADEWKRLFKRLDHLTPQEREEVERSMETVVRKILSDPILFLREGEEGSIHERSEVVRKLFSLSGSKRSSESA